MKDLDKYLLMLLLIANVTSEYQLLAPVSKVLFYTVLVIGIPMILSNWTTSSSTKVKFPELSTMMLLYLIAQFIVQIDLLTIDNILYTITKVVVFAIIIISISNNYEYYYKRILDFVPNLILFLLLFGWIYNRYDSYGNLTFGFVNRNVACTIATTAFAGIIFGSDKYRVKDIFALLFLFITILYGGSRNALAMCILITLVRFGLSFKLVVACLIASIFAIFVLPYMGIEITALNRLIGTIDGSVSIDREIEREAAINMINARPWSGWGYSYANLSGIAMNAHNGYLTMIENLGWPCGGCVLLCIIWGSIRRLRLYFLKNRIVNFHLAIILSTLFGANQEDYLIGVNQFTTNFFFVSFAVLGVYIYYHKFKSNETG